MPYTTHPFYTLTDNQPDGSAREVEGGSHFLALSLKFSLGKHFQTFVKLVQDDA